MQIGIIRFKTTFNVRLIIGKTLPIKQNFNTLCMDLYK